MMFLIVPLASAIGIMGMPHVHLLAEWEAFKANTPQRKHKGTQTRSLRENRGSQHPRHATQHGSDLNSFFSNHSLPATSRTDEKIEGHARQR